MGFNFNPFTGNLDYFEPGVVRSSSTYQTQSLAADAAEDFDLPLGKVYTLLKVASTFPCWIRFFDSAAARTADSRTQPGGTPPAAGEGYYAELITVGPNGEVTMSPVAVAQGDATGRAYIRVVNRDNVSRVLDLTITTSRIEA